ncbi:restriction endonuclease subunit S [Vibrio cyclitrophicus]|uniref:restriction endonuclease subunit S n=1 Tax=Vibrio cyclitrophicus TaxID=47951 RepID=UPI000C847F7D|nr:restriction endonuclease subunit S [Vibrio cyclitrophicus]PMK21916.1 hypothetical protein BCU04_19440 [Vibrio cyclitrophicus]
MVPNGWSLKLISDTAKVITGNTPSTKDSSYYNGDIPFVSPADLGANKLISSANKTLTKKGFEKSRAVRKGSTLFTCIGSTIGKLGQANCELATNQQINAVIPYSSFDDDFIYYQLEMRAKFISKLAGTQAVPIINKTTFESQNLLVPDSLPEQRKIAKILSTWDKAISTTEKLIEASKQQKKALMQQLLTGKKRLVNPETGKAFEGEWEEVPLSNWLVEFKEKSSVQDQHRVYTSSRSGLVPQDEYFGNSRISDRKNIGFHILPPGHMTYRSRSDDGYFTFNLFKGNENGIISHYYPVFTSKGSNDFFIALLEQYRNVFGKHSVGTSQKVLSFNALKAIRFFVPSTYEQQKIASVLTTADKEIEVLETKLAHFKQEKKALMQQLLTGKRRVKVDEMEVA